MEVEHKITVKQWIRTYVHFYCACGHLWKNPQEWDEQQHDEIFDAHVLYYNKQLALVL